jgi:uncharacterized protein (UPF0332 family)
MHERVSIYFEKAQESLAGASSEYANGRYNNCANRCYYACFQAAVHALLEVGMAPPPTRSTWSHEQVQAGFARELIHRRKVYPATLRDALSRTYLLRQTADYTTDVVSGTQAERALRRTRSMLETIGSRGGASA